jgi:hypothetical protein
MVATKRYIQHSGFSRAILCSEKKVIRSCAHLEFAIHSGYGNRSQRLDFLGNSHGHPLPHHELGMRYLCTVPQTLK